MSLRHGWETQSRDSFGKMGPWTCPRHVAFGEAVAGVHRRRYLSPSVVAPVSVLVRNANHEYHWSVPPGGILGGRSWRLSWAQGRGGSKASCCSRDRMETDQSHGDPRSTFAPWVAESGDPCLVSIGHAPVPDDQQITRPSSFLVA